jgi:alpha-L-rhamnosidase
VTGPSGRPTQLRVEYLEEPLGTTCRSPRLSWWLPEGASTQVAYRVRTDRWDSGRVDSPASVLVPYGGPALSSRERSSWQVKVWTDRGESDWSASSWWEMGLLDPADWSARWVAPVEDEPGTPGGRPAHLFRHELRLGAPAVRARAYATAHGIYELFVNGTRVGDRELTPGATSYRTHLEVQTYDVTDLLAPGPNVVGAVLSDGWYRSKTGFTRAADCFGTELALLVQIEADLADGPSVPVSTGAGWSTRRGSITAADLVDGQRVDLRTEPAGWSAPGSAVEEWRDAPVVDHDLRRLTSSPAPPVRRIEELRPVAVRELEPGRHVVDLGQNINGWVRLTDLGPAGTELTLTYGEMLDEAGDVDQRHLEPFSTTTRQRLPAGQVDQVVAAGAPGEVFEPRHTTHGFQYVRVEGHPGHLGPDDLTGVVVHSDLRRTGWFRCSDERLNRLHEAAVWSLRGNVCDVPTDCPQRERAGWTGDWQIFFPTAAFLYDVAGFTARWLRDLAADQWPDGRVPNFVPDPAGPEWRSRLSAQFITGSAGWGDAAVIVPWEMWRAYGDERLLAEQFDSMAAWVDFAALMAREGPSWAAAADPARWARRFPAEQQPTIEAAIDAARHGRHARRFVDRPDPAPHEQFLWDSGFHWGEWLEPGADTSEVFTLGPDMGDIATAYLHRSSSLLAQAATILGRDAEAARYADLAAAVLDAWRTEFVGPDGALTPDTQANHVRALAFGLVPEQRRPAAARRLVELIREADTHLGTGFLATPDLLPVLADHHHLDVAYELLLQDTPPSWLHMIDKGATTIWENWEGLDRHGTGSLNHYSKGAVVSFLHRYVAGIRPGGPADPTAYRRFRIQPQPGGDLTWAEAQFDSPYGRIASSWRIEAGRFHLDVAVPPGTTAQVVLPDGTTEIAPPGARRCSCVLDDRRREERS